MAVKAQEIADKGLRLLQDIDGVRWPADTDILGWINDGLREMVRLKPSVAIQTVTASLVAGSKQQIIGLAIEKFVHFNPVSLEFLNGALPGWQNHEAAAAIELVAFDPNDPKSFWTYPPQPAQTNTTLQISQVMPPVAVTDLNTNLPYDDTDMPALIDYVCYRCFLGETAADTTNKAISFWTAFAGKLGSKSPMPMIPPAQAEGAQ